MSREAGADRGGQPLDFGGKPYRSLDYECKRIFGQKLYKISLNGGMTCPQPGRDAGHAGLYFLQRRRERGLRPAPGPVHCGTDRGGQASVPATGTWEAGL